MVMREREEWNEAKPKEMLNVFQSTFSRSEMKQDLEFALAKLRGLCKYLANVYNSHSHVYGLHGPICAQETRQENQFNEASRPLKELSVVST